jgi:hypothetical protein
MAACIFGSILASLAKLKALRCPGESYSDVILRLAKGDAGLGNVTERLRSARIPLSITRG